MQRRLIKRPNTYYDSVTLMRISSEAKRVPGVSQVAVVMVTEMNRAILADTGFDPAEYADMGPNDLVIGLVAETEEALGAALIRVDELLNAVGQESGQAQEERVQTLEGALARMPEANLAIVSTPGAFAAREALKALKNGLHVMIFSDNVALEKEVALKQEAQRRGLLVMGPDCGTAIVHGVPLGFVNVVRRGTAGLVAASGTGLQEVAVLVHQLGAGISQAIGTGGRDLSDEVGGITMLQGIDLLEHDPGTERITLVSKPPAPATMQRLLERVRRMTKPCVVCFLGADEEVVAQARSAGLKMATTLEEAALLTVESPATPLPDATAEVAAAVATEAARYPQGKRPGAFVRGLFSGGTLCHEAYLTLQAMLPDVSSNLAQNARYKLENPNESRGHTLVDMGDDYFTQSRPHPMIDASYRLERIRKEAMDPETAVVLFDVVLGYGSNSDPGGAIAEEVARLRAELAAAGRYVAFIASVTGTEEDPQPRSEQVARLREAGVTILSTNYRAARAAGLLVETLKGVGA